MPRSTREWLAIPPSEYFEMEDAYGSGAIRCFALAGQLVFYDKYVLKNRPDKDSQAKRLGRAFHAAMETDGDGWADRYTIIPDAIHDDEFVEQINSGIKGGVPLEAGKAINLKLPSHRAYMEAHRLKALSDGKDFVSPGEALKVESQVRAVYDNAACRDLLSQKKEFQAETTCVLTHESGIKLKALVDLALFDSMVDFKTTRFHHPNDFLRFALSGKTGYDWQAAHYCLVTGKRKFYFISVTNSSPYEANLFEMPDRQLGRLMLEIEKQTFQLAQLLADDISGKDSQGIPYSFHSELWGTAIPMELEY